MEEKKQVIHQFKFGSQLFWLVVGLTFFYFAIKKNPTSEDFVKEVANQYAKKEIGLSSAPAETLSSIFEGIFGSLLNSMIKRNDFLVFSTYSFSYSDKDYEVELSGIGFWDNIYLDTSSHFRKIRTSGYDTNGGDKDAGDKDAGDNDANRPKVTFQNSTSDTISYCFAYPETNGTEKYISKGWWSIAPGETSDVDIPAICDKSGEFYYYASGGYLKWSGQYDGNRFSVTNDAFNFSFDKNPSESYKAEAFKKLGYSSENGWTRNVVFSKSNADEPVNSVISHVPY